MDTIIDRINGTSGVNGNGHAPPVARLDLTADPVAGPTALRRGIVRLCLQALDHSPTPAPVRVTIRQGQTRIVYDVSEEEARAVLGPPSVRGLSPVEAAIYAVLTDHPQTAKTLARLSGYKLNAHFRGGIRGLERRDPPLCMRGTDGYRRPPTLHNSPAKNPGP